MAISSMRSRLCWTVLLTALVASAPAAATRGLVAQRIGEVPDAVADAIAAKVAVVPLSRRLDPRTTPIILASGKAFIREDGQGVAGLKPAERRALQLAYRAGQVILLLDASTHDIAALHRLLRDGVVHESSTDPVVLAYALRKRNGIPTARIVTYPVKGHRESGRLELDEPDGEGSTEDAAQAERVLASRRALAVVVEELARPLDASGPAGSSADWGSSPVQEFIITSTDRGTYNTPIELFALHSCARNKDYFLVNTGGTWTPERAQYASASKDSGRLRLDQNGNLIIIWQNDSDQWCTGGIDVYRGDRRVCGYFNYPLTYTVEIEPPPSPARVIQVNAAPAGDQGQSTSYTSGFTFSIGGGVDVSGSGPSGGFQAGVSWDNSVTTTVPALVVEAGNKGNQGTFTRYRYCTSGSNIQNCTSNVQMTGEQLLCRSFIVGRPQPGQTPNGRLSNIAQTVNWQVDPASYKGTFDVTVTFDADLVQSVSLLWGGQYVEPAFPTPGAGPTGMCNLAGCDCGIATTSPQGHLRLSHTFKVPRPSTQCAARSEAATGPDPAPSEEVEGVGRMPEDPG